MEIEYHDKGRRGKVIVVIGIVLALVAGVGAFYAINQAQQQATQTSRPLTRTVVAVATIPARQAIKASDVATRDVALDPANAIGLATSPSDVVGRVPAVTILQGQIVTTNMLASTTQGGQFSILQPNETVTADSTPWRAVALTVPDDLAVGGMLTAGESVDVFVTTPVTVPPDVAQGGRFISERSTKLAYQDIFILARQEAFYIVRVSLPVAEEIAHLQAAGSTFSLALRPDVDHRVQDTTNLGETTNKIIEKYRLPIPEPLVPGGGSPSTTSPTSGMPGSSPAPSGAPGGSPAPSASPAP